MFVKSNRYNMVHRLYTANTENLYKRWMFEGRPSTSEFVLQIVLISKSQATYRISKI